MMPKITLKAPPQIDGGTIHASGSGKNYFMDEQGKVTVDSVDVGDLVRLGFVQVGSDGSDAEAAAITTSVSPTSATQGAQALDPEVRQAGQRTETVQPGATGTAADFGGAIPPHGLPHSDPGTDPKIKADAENEALTVEATGGDPSKPSAQAQTGAPNQQAATADVQDKVAQDAAKP